MAETTFEEGTPLTEEPKEEEKKEGEGDEDIES